MKPSVRLVIALGVLAGCNSSETTKGQGEEEKKTLETVAAELKQPVATISAYLPHVAPEPDPDKYAPKRRPEVDRAAAAAANEIRHAANKARQKIPSAAGAIGKDLTAALVAVTKDCAEAADEEALAKCKNTALALDEALGKAATGMAAAGVTAKVPRVSPESITDEARAQIASLLKTKGPGKAEAEFRKKRADPNASFADVQAACQAALSEVEAIAAEHEKAEEPIRLIAVTHKMSMDSQCNTLNLTEDIRRGVEACRKKPTTPECKVACSKARKVVEDGVPAATFASMEKDVPEICKDDQK